MIYARFIGPVTFSAYTSTSTLLRESRAAAGVSTRPKVRHLKSIIEQRSAIFERQMLAYKATFAKMLIAGLVTPPSPPRRAASQKDARAAAAAALGRSRRCRRRRQSDARAWCSPRRSTSIQDVAGIKVRSSTAAMPRRRQRRVGQHRRRPSPQPMPLARRRLGKTAPLGISIAGLAGRPARRRRATACRRTSHASRPPRPATAYRR